MLVAPAEVIVYAQTSKTKYPVFVKNEIVFDQKLVVINSDSRELFAVLTSNLHYAWAHARGGTMRTDAVYNPSDVFETYPFPPLGNTSLETLGVALDTERRAVMNARNIGLTNFYNMFHDPGCGDAHFVELRALHIEIES